MNKYNQMYIKLTKKVLFISLATTSSLFLAFLTLGISSVASAQSTNETCSRKWLQDKRYCYFKRGNTYYNHGEYQKAINDYTQVIQLTPSHILFYLPEAYYNLGNIYYKLEKPQLAIDNYTLSIKSQYYHQFPEAYYNLSIVRAKLGDEQGAVEDLNSLMDLYLNPSNDVLSTIKIYESNGKELSSREMIPELDLSNLDGNIIPILQEIRWQSYGYPLIPRKASYNLAMSSYNLAMTMYKHAVSLTNSNMSSTPRKDAWYNLARTMYNQGVSLVRQKNYKDARIKLQSAIRVFNHPCSMESQCNRDAENAAIVQKVIDSLPKK